MIINPTLKKALAILGIAFLVLAGSVSSYYFGKQEAKKEIINDVFFKGALDETAKNLDFTLFWDAWQTLKQEFIDKTKFDNQKMLYGAISGMVNSLKDPYTVFMDPDESKRFSEDTAGKFEGVGLEIGKKKEQLQVISPLEGTPAKKAGLRAGDKIVKIDNVFTNDLTVDEAVSKIRGPKGSQVTLTIFREGWNNTKDFTITRDTIVVPSLKWEIKDNNIAYVQLYQFSEKADADFKKAALEIFRSPAKKIIIDLRNNPGGYLEVARSIASFFLEQGSVVVIEDFGGKKEQEKELANGNSMFLDFPVVILINQGSASASEILAGALRDNRQIKLIGETSFGKGSVQQVKDFADGSSLKVTVAKWLTPKGVSISDHGLDPDFKVDLTDQDYEQGKDPQLFVSIPFKGA